MMKQPSDKKFTIAEVLTNFAQRQAQVQQEKMLKQQLKDVLMQNQANALSQFVPGMQQQMPIHPEDMGFDEYYQQAKRGGIKVDPRKKGTFKAQATRMGMSIQEAAAHILANKEDYSPAMVKKANFAKNFAKEEGGEMIKRADGSYSQRGLWDNIRANKGSGKKPTKEMLEQERKIKKYFEGGIQNCPEGYTWDVNSESCVPAEPSYSGMNNEMFQEDSLSKFIESSDKFDKAIQELEFAKQQYPELESKYTAAQDALRAEQLRVKRVRANVIPASRQLDMDDNAIIKNEKYYNKYLEDYYNAENPKQLAKATANLPREVKNVLPNQGRYNVAQWQGDDWNPQLHPGRELYCTPYGCFAYQKAGANDVPIIPGNMQFASMASKGTLPFQKISASDRQPGDIGLMVEMSPADYSKPGSPMIMRPHHTTVYDSPLAHNPNDLSAGNFYNAREGNRLMFDKTEIDMPSDGRMDYYRYVGKTRQLESNLKGLEEQKRLEAERLNNMQSSIRNMSLTMPILKPTPITGYQTQYELQIPEPSPLPSKRRDVKNVLSKFFKSI